MGSEAGGSFLQNVRNKNVFICWWDKFSNRKIHDKGGSRKLLSG